MVNRHKAWIRGSFLVMGGSIVAVLLSLFTILSAQTDLGCGLFMFSIASLLVSIFVVTYHQDRRDKTNYALYSYRSQLQYAQNLEKARDWTNAAMAYQNLGLFEKAASIRQQYTESSPASTNINVGRIGDTVLHDSVVGELNEPN